MNSRTSEVLGPSDLNEPVLKRLFEYWLSKHVGDQPPSRDDIDPLELPDILPHVGLIDVDWSGDEVAFRYRLIGTAMSEMFGEDFTGTYLYEQKSGYYADFLHDLYLDVASSKRPILSESQFGYRGRQGVLDRSHLWIRRLMLPLVEHGVVTMMLFTNHFQPANDEQMRAPYLQRDIVDVSETLRAYVESGPSA